MSRPNKGLFLWMTTPEEARVNAGVGEVGYTTKIFQYTKKKWRGLQRGPYTDLFLVSQEELQTLFGIVRRTNDAFLILNPAGPVPAKRDLLAARMFCVVLLEDRRVESYDLGSQRTALAYRTRLLQLVGESSLQATTKKEVGKLLELCFGGLLR